ncbi:isopentenyl phosphate kinase-like [Lolium rigidum]|uniref:isopentenyl phosphate kinase-like n=1 Tax=Lolium rigidum TaxID=89674 RepID=UPI001F5D45D4|nr:isopentenyl phosphate kinase-like [Lolium rigidum]
MAEAATKQRSPDKPRPVRCIVKLGGAAITNKGELQSIDEGSLRSACAQLRQAMSGSGDATPEKVMGMDWSRRPDDPADPAVDTEGFRDMAGLGIDTNFIVVHDAGSFGHFQASRSGVHKGGLHTPLVKAGFVATRISSIPMTFSGVAAPDPDMACRSCAHVDRRLPSSMLCSSPLFVMAAPPASADYML